MVFNNDSKGADLRILGWVLIVVGGALALWGAVGFWASTLGDEAEAVRDVFFRDAVLEVGLGVSLICVGTGLRRRFAERAHA